MKEPGTDKFKHCGSDFVHFQRVPVVYAAALWCNIPPDEIDWVIKSSTQVGRAIYKHPSIPCLEPKCRAIHEAIENGDLPVYREQGDQVIGHVAPERRHVSRAHLREWISKHYPSQRPPTLFDEVERTAHAAIDAQAYQALKAKNDQLETELKDARQWAEKTLSELAALRAERDALRAKVDTAQAPSDRAEGTYLRIIGALQGLMLSTSPGGQRYSILQSQSAIIDGLLALFPQVPGLSRSTLEAKFAEAKRALDVTRLP